MNFQYYFRHMTSSDALKYEVEKKMSSGLEGLILSSTPIHVTFSIEAGQCKIHVGLHARNNALIEAEAVTDDMHKSVDEVMDTLHRLLSQEKDRLLRHQTKVDPFREAFPPTPVSEKDDFVEEEFAPAP